MMKKRKHILLLLLFSLCTVMGYADRETVAQSFNSMYPSELELSADYKTITTDKVTYTCTGGTTQFWLDHQFGTVYSIVLAESVGTVTTTKVNELIGFQILSRPNSKNDKVKVYVSKDGVDFGTALSGDKITYDKSGTIDVSIPRGNYYIRIVNTNSSSKCSLTRIDYYLDHCNCFEYIPE